MKKVTLTKSKSGQRVFSVDVGEMSITEIKQLINEFKKDKNK